MPRRLTILTIAMLLCVAALGPATPVAAQTDRVTQMGFVAAMLAFQLWLSPLWLSHYRFGPAEWLWRSLTYGQPQPMRRHKPS